MGYEFHNQRHVSPAVSLAFSEGWAILDVVALRPLPVQLLGSLGIYSICRTAQKQLLFKESCEGLKVNIT